MNALSNDTAVDPLKFYLFTLAAYGNARVDINTGLFTYQCTYTGAASEVIEYYVYDGHNVAYARVNVTIFSQYQNTTTVTSILTASTIAGIAAGIAALVIFVGVLIVYLVYQKYIAKRFEDQVR